MLTALIITVLLLAGCGGSQVATSERQPPAEQPAPSRAEAEPQVTGGENVERYFELLASQDPREMQLMADVAADGSPAQLYAELQYVLLVALQESQGAGMTGAKNMRITRAGSIEHTSQPIGFEGDVEQRLLFSGFQLTDGELASFEVSVPGEVEPIRIDDRLIEAGQQQGVAGNTARLLGAYHSVESDSLYVAVETEAVGDRVEYAFGDTYVTDDGRRVASTTFLGNDRPRAGRETPYVVVFDAVDVGGTAEVPVHTSDDYNEAGTLIFDL